MKRILRPALFAALILGASTTGLFAQTPSPGPQGSPPDGPPPGHHGPPPSPLFRALDTNHDGVISAEEIAAAPAVLKALAGPSGQLTRESLRPARREDDRREDDRRPLPDGSQGPGPEHQDRHHGPPPPDEQGPGPERQNRRHGPPPDAQDSPAASPDGQPNHPPRPQHRPDDRRQGPPPDGEPRDQQKQQAAPSPGGSPGASPSDRPDGPRHGPPHGDRLFDYLDTNRDGVLSADEIAAAATSLKQADTNGDGQIDHRDMRPPPPPPSPSSSPGQ